MSQVLRVVVPTPAHSALGDTLSYLSEFPLSPGTLVRVPLGRRETLGIVWQAAQDATRDDAGHLTLRPLSGVFSDLPPLALAWRELIAFTSAYYQRSLGEVALAALPPQLREMDPTQLQRRLKRRLPGAARPDAPAAGASTAADDATTAPSSTAWPEPSAEQAATLAALGALKGPCLIFGATGSGKTEVYLRAVQSMLAQDPQAQALIMVPEINLTPQLEDRFLARLAPICGAARVVSLHSGMTPPQRLRSWLAAHTGQARVVLGTRLAVLASIPNLRLLVVDEEHDPSYKQQEGARYSARDLAVYRGRQQNAQVLLGSATPSLESWHHSRGAAEGGRYARLEMPSRIGPQARLPQVRRVDMNHQPRRALIAPPLLDAVRQRIAAGEQSLLLLNRRGYAPVLHCSACDWKSSCPHCSAFRVFHKIDRSLRCHHCGFAEPVPRACPSCGNLDITPIGRGTERLAEHLAELLADTRRPDGEPVQIERIDADSTRLAGSLETRLARVHSGEVDVLVGTQMVAKGHDFRRITLVAAVNPDNALFSSDFRAPERLFALLMQAAGRAGRDALASERSEMWLQTFHPRHALFDALARHDYPAFARQQLAERHAAGLPPFSHQALLRCDARAQEVAQAFLRAAAESARSPAQALPGLDQLTLYPPVPLGVQRVANVERAQMLVEGSSRRALQAFLAAWQPLLHSLRQSAEGRGVLRWAIDVDPIAI
jgi:primosomal protein N' (replication factor Y) (superfamily II helicase)